MLHIARSVPTLRVFYIFKDWLGPFDILLSDSHVSQKYMDPSTAEHSKKRFIAKGPVKRVLVRRLWYVRKISSKLRSSMLA